MGSPRILLYRCHHAFHAMRTFGYLPVFARYSSDALVDAMPSFSSYYALLIRHCFSAASALCIFAAYMYASCIPRLSFRRLRFTPARRRFFFYMRDIIRRAAAWFTLHAIPWRHRATAVLPPMLLIRRVFEAIKSAIVATRRLRLLRFSHSYATTTLKLSRLSLLLHAAMP